MSKRSQSSKNMSDGYGVSQDTEMQKPDKVKVDHPDVLFTHYDYQSDYFDSVCQDKTLIGQGSFGDVYRCRNPKTRTEYALKIQSAGSDSQIESILSENLVPDLLVARCRRDNVKCRVPKSLGLDFYRVDDRRYGASRLQLIPDGSVKITDEKNDDTLRWGIDNFIENMFYLATDVYELHSIGILHRDIKPPNLLLKRKRAHIGNEFWYEQYKMYLSDFGLSCQFSNDKSQENQEHKSLTKVKKCGDWNGTRAYYDPQTAIIGVHPTNDVYALGVTLWELLNNARYSANITQTLRYVSQLGEISEHQARILWLNWQKSNWILHDTIRHLMNDQPPRKYYSRFWYVYELIRSMTYPLGYKQRVNSQYVFLMMQRIVTLNIDPAPEPMKDESMPPGYTSLSLNVSPSQTHQDPFIYTVVNDTDHYVSLSLHSASPPFVFKGYTLFPGSTREFYDEGYMGIEIPGDFTSIAQLPVFRGTQVRITQKKEAK